jgi:hypothetical protein
MSKLNLFSIFHLNIAYSSIPESQYGTVIKRCYWPLLNIAEKTGVKIGIEATGYTLEKIQELDPAWIVKLKELIENKKVEFVASGYAQVIGPLVPAEVVAKNLQFGNEIYKKLLTISPTLAYINEQAYSQGILDHYRAAHFEAIVMEWNNPATYHHEWPKEWKYFPQTAQDQKKRTINVVWNNSIAFQKFQRFIYDNITLDEYNSYPRVTTK